MPDKPLTPEEITQNRDALRYIKEWLQFRDLTQRRLADILGVSEPTVSKWLGGTQAMTVAQFTAISRALCARPEDILLPPPAGGDGRRYRELAEIVDSMSAEDLTHYIAIGRSMTGRRKGS